MMANSTPLLATAAQSMVPCHAETSIPFRSVSPGRSFRGVAPLKLVGPAASMGARIPSPGSPAVTASSHSSGCVSLNHMGSSGLTPAGSPSASIRSRISASPAALAGTGSSNPSSRNRLRNRKNRLVFMNSTAFLSKDYKIVTMHCNTVFPTAQPFSRFFPVISQKRRTGTAGPSLFCVQLVSPR